MYVVAVNMFSTYETGCLASWPILLHVWCFFGGINFVYCFLHVLRSLVDTYNPLIAASTYQCQHHDWGPLVMVL